MSWFIKISKFELLVTTIENVTNKLQSHLHEIGKLDEKNLKKVFMYKRQTQEWKIACRRYSIIVILMYVSIYCSLASVFFGQIFFLGEVLSFLSKIISVTGTTIFLIVLFIAQYIRELLYQKLLLIHSQIMLECSIYKIKPEFMFDIKENNEYIDMVELLHHKK